MLLLDVFLLIAATLGHLAICVGSYNRVHSLPIHYRLIKVLDVPHMLVAIAFPAFLTWQIIANSAAFSSPQTFWSEQPFVMAYASVCLIAAVYITVLWARRVRTRSDRGSLVANDTTYIDVAQELGCRPIRGSMNRLAAAIPGNELLKLSIHTKRLALQGLPAPLDGLSIVHLSDLHFCGKIDRDYFRYVISRANELQPDLIAITGDILEKEMCYAWLPETLGSLKSRYATYFVLGNHDKRVADAECIRRSLVELGMKDAGRQTFSLDLNGCQIVISGNERPWFGPPPEPHRSTAPDPAFRILLSHSPDQIEWARRHGFDLMLAGHTHGGQIRFPVVGPVVCPSRFGVKYASGVFDEPPTLMHVSRGLSGVDLLRFNCPPELTKLVLQCARRGRVKARDDGFV